jgi:hypothetical protein
MRVNPMRKTRKRKVSQSAYGIDIKKASVSSVMDSFVKALVTKRD